MVSSEKSFNGVHFGVGLLLNADVIMTTDF